MLNAVTQANEVVVSNTVLRIFFKISPLVKLQKKSLSLMFVIRSYSVFAKMVECFILMFFGKIYLHML